MKKLKLILLFIILFAISSRESNGQLYEYWIERDTLNGLTVDSTSKRIDNSIREFNKVCGVRINKTQNINLAEFKIYFKTNAQMRATQSNGSTPLGVAYPDGRIWLNKDRRLNPKSNVPEDLIRHEIMHTRLFGFQKHVSDLECTMGPSGGSWYFCPNEVRTLQRRFGRPAHAFWPLDRKHWGDMMNIRLAEWEELKRQRNAELDMTKRAAIHVKVMANVESQKNIARKWFHFNNKWKGVPYAAFPGQVTPSSRKVLSQAPEAVELTIDLRGIEESYKEQGIMTPPIEVMLEQEKTDPPAVEESVLETVCGNKD